MQLLDAQLRLSHLKQRYEITLGLHVDNITYSNSRLAWVCKETESCLVLSKVCRLTHDWWPVICRQTPRIEKKYWDIHDELMSDGSLLLKSSRGVNPYALTESFLHDLHEEYPGITKCQCTAWTLVHWPSIRNDIEDYMKWCPTCIRLSPTLPAKPLINQNDIPIGPWQKLVLTSLTGMAKNFYLPAVSANTSSLSTSSTTANAVINHPTELYALRGTPEEVYNNGKPFSSKDWYSFADKYDFKPTHSSPHNPSQMAS